MSVVQLDPSRRATQGERIASLEAWQSQHEQRCEERQTGIISRLGRIETAGWAIAIGLLGWTASQLWQAAGAG